MAGDRGWTDRRMDIVIGNLLRSGVVLSALIVFLGAVIYLARHGPLTPITEYSVVSHLTYVPSEELFAR